MWAGKKADCDGFTVGNWLIPGDFNVVAVTKGELEVGKEVPGGLILQCLEVTIKVLGKGITST